MNAVFLFPSNMLIRNGKYYYRRRVPVDLVDLFNRKEITKTLRTTRALDATRLKLNIHHEPKRPPPIKEMAFSILSVRAVTSSCL